MPLWNYLKNQDKYLHSFIYYYFLRTPPLQLVVKVELDLVLYELCHRGICKLLPE